MNLNSRRERGVHRLRERFKAESASAMLDAAEEVFAAHGLHGAAMSDIAARAGVAVGTLYNHFVDRERLLAALLERRRAELYHRLDEAQRQAARAPFRAQLEALLGALFVHFDAHRRFLLIQLQSELPKSDDKAREIYRRLDKVIRRGVKEGVLRADAAALYPGFLVGILRGLVLRELYGEATTRLADHTDLVVDFFLRGAGKRQGEPSGARRGASAEAVPRRMPFR
jgi:AcrR family transcriptional regulator